MMLAGSIGVALFLSPYIVNFLPFQSSLSSIGTDGGVSAESRIVECACCIGSTYLLETQILKQKIADTDMNTKLMIILASDFVSTYGQEYLAQTPLQFIAGSGI